MGEDEETRPRDDDGGDRGGRGERGEPNKLFIGQLAFEAEEGDIQEKFGRYGEILNIQIIKDNMTGKSKGYGFIKFAETSDAEKVLRTMDGAEICGRKCKLDRAGGGRQNANRFDDRRGGGRGRDGKVMEPEKLFIGKLSPDATEDDVREAFRRVGEIKVQLIKDRDSGESRGFGFITFSDASKAEEALRSYQGTEIAGQGCRLERPGQKPQAGQRGGRDSRSPSRRGRRGERSRSRDRRRDDFDRRGGHRRPRDYYDARPRDRDRRRGGRGDRGDRGDRDRGDRDRGDRGDRGDRRGDRGDRDRGDRDRRDRGDRGRDRERDDRDDREDRDESDSRDDSRAAESEPRDGRRSRTPDGLPRKSEAISAARNAYEDAYERVQDARAEADEAEASLKKMEKQALHAIDRKVADETERIKSDLEDKLSEMRKVSKNALALAMDQAELKIREELAAKIAQIRKEYDGKVKEEHARVRREHEDEAEDAETKEQEKAEKRIEELRKKAEKEEKPWEWRDARDKAVDTLEKEEEKLESAKRKLESLTGQPVKEPRSRSTLPQEKRRQGRGRD